MHTARDSGGSVQTSLQQDPLVVDWGRDLDVRRDLSDALPEATAGK